MSGLRLERVNLSASPWFIYTGGFDRLEHDRLEFIHSADFWSLYFYHHDNAVTINARTYPINAGDISILPPGGRVVHARSGEGTAYDYLCFDMPGKGTERGAMPHVVKDAQEHYEDWLVAREKIMDSCVPMRAFAWHFMCLHAKNVALIRKDELLYDAEAWITTNIGKPFTVTEMCAELNISPRSLLRSFRLEHGVTVQEYIIRQRIQVAARLLTTTPMQPKLVAQAVGIPNLQHFNKLMRQHTGVSPRSFQTKPPAIKW